MMKGRLALSFEGIVDSCNIDFFGQDLLALVGDQGEKEFPPGCVERR